MSKRTIIGLLPSAGALASAALPSVASADLLSSTGQGFKQSTSYTAGTFTATDNNDFSITAIPSSPQAAGYEKFASTALTTGETITLSGTVVLAGAPTTGVGTEQFRFGLFNTNGSSGEAGWLGYLYENASNAPGAGAVDGKLTGNSSNGPSTSSSGYTIGSPPATASAMGSDTYTFLLAITQTGSNALSVTSSLTGATDICGR
jgi:hypothetical protein